MNVEGDTSIYVKFDSSFNAGNIEVRSISSCGVNTTSRILTLQKTIPVTPTLLTGSTDIYVCSQATSGSVYTYKTAKVTNATSYIWTVPSSAILLSGQGDSVITVKFDSSFNSGNISVKAANACGISTSAKNLSVSKKLPTSPVTLIASADVCSSIGTNTLVKFNTNKVAYATTYIWSVPNGATIQSVIGDTAIMVKFDSSFNGGIVSVKSASSCGINNVSKILSLTKQTPTTPSAINGITNACPYYGNNTSVTYSTPAVNFATSYLWTLPANVTLVSGQGTNTIVVKFDSGYVTASFKVKALNACGSSNEKSVQVTANPFATPGTISGPTNACMYINQSSATYSIRKVTGATGYYWSVPTGVTITSHPAGTGANDTTIVVTFGTNFVANTAIQVSSAGCNLSAPSSLTITGSIATVPGTITGATNVCEMMVSGTRPGGDSVIYTIRKVTGATSYIWTAPTNATLSHPAGLGANDTIVKVLYSSSFVSGTLSVKSSNSCGSSSAKTLAISISTAAQPGTITAQLVSACPNRVYYYSINAIPANATSLVWTAPAGGTIIAGQGTIKISVSYPSTASISNNVTVQAYNNCSASSLRTLNVKLTACSGGFSYAKTETIIENNLTPTLDVSVFPNPSSNYFNVKAVSGNQERIFVRVLDLQGRIVKELNMKSNEVKQVGDNLKPGNYILQVVQGNKTKTTKLMKI